MHLDHDPVAAAGEEIGFADFLRVDIRVGTIVAAEVYEGTRKPSFKLRIDFRAIVGERRSVGQVVAFCTPRELIRRQVAAVVKFPPRQIGKAIWEALTLGFADEEGRVCCLPPTSRCRTVRACSDDGLWASACGRWPNRDGGAVSIR